MKKLDNRSAWDKAWEKKFAEAEEVPPMHNWAGIEARLASAETDRYKRRAAFFQWVAAAAVMLTIGTTAYWLSYVPDQGMGNTTLAEQTETTSSTQNSISAKEEASPVLANKQTDGQNQSTAKTAAPSAAADESMGSAIAYQQQGGKKVANQETTALALADKQNEGDQGTEGNISALLLTGLGDAPLELDFLTSKDFIAFNFGEVQTEIERVWLFRKSGEPKRDAAEDSRYWLGTTVAANTFNPNFKEEGYAADAFAPALSVGKGEASLAQTDSWQQEEQAEPSVNLSVQGGMQLSKRWSLQAGVQYGAYRVNSQAGTYIDLENSQAYPLHYSNFSPERLQRVRAGSRLANPVAVTNNFELLSLPLRVGYTLIDGKFNLTLNPGIASEIFLRNQLIAENDLVNSYTVHNGGDSPFRSMYFSGILGAQLSYILGDHYLFTLEPSYRQALTDFNKSDAIFTSRPSSLGLGVGIRYLIK